MASSAARIHQEDLAARGELADHLRPTHLALANRHVLAGPDLQSRPGPTCCASPGGHVPRYLELALYLMATSSSWQAKQAEGASTGGGAAATMAR